MASKCRYYYELGELRSAARKWLKKNPPPASFTGSAWEWAYKQMPRD